MKCPVCKETSLVMSERKGVEIDYCPDCRGVWLDRGELDKILERSRDEEPARAQNSNYQVSTQSQPGYQEKSYKRKKSFLEELFD